MQQLFSTTPYKLNQLLEKIDIGSLGLLELQRPFVWKDAKVRDLFDSMMKGYPIGFLMLWDCPQLDKKKLIGVESHSYPTPPRSNYRWATKINLFICCYKRQKSF